MPTLPFLDVALGLAFIYLILSLFCSGINELIELVIKHRAADLLEGIRMLVGAERVQSRGRLSKARGVGAPARPVRVDAIETTVNEGMTARAARSASGPSSTGARSSEKPPTDLSGEELVDAIYSHPLIQGLFGKEGTGIAPLELSSVGQLGRGLPAYIPSGHFARAIIDLAVTRDTPGAIAGRLSPANPYLAKALRPLAELAGEDLDRFRLEIEGWYNGAMDRVSGWYKRRTQWFIFGIAAVATVVMNVDTIAIGSTLSSSPALRQATVATVESFATAHRLPDGTWTQPDTSAINASIARLDEIGIPMGWRGDGPGDAWDEFLERPFTRLFGWLLTVVAISLGAPFWFDLLNRIMVIRSTVKPREKSRDEGSEDRRRG